MNWRGRPLVDLNTIVSLIGSTHSRAGLHVRAELDRGRYPAGITVTDRGWLKNGKFPGDYSRAPRCGARNRRGLLCRCPAMRNGRCRLHGGLSTGPRTPEGLERSRRARWRHGLRSREVRELLRANRQRWRALMVLAAPV